MIRENWWLVSHGQLRAFDERCHKTFETVAAESVRADSQNTDAALFQCDRSFSIGCGSIGVVMHVTIDLDTGANLSAVQIDDEALDHLLAVELQTEQAPPAYELPRKSLGRSGVLALRSRERDLPRVHWL